MSINILVDMNLSPDWIALLQQHGYDAIHWSAVGDLRAADATIMQWARDNRHIVFTHDLDFGTALALTHEQGPSVIQLRAQDVLPDRTGKVIIAAIQRHLPDLASGALLVVDESRARVRLLPI